MALRQNFKSVIKRIFKKPRLIPCLLLILFILLALSLPLPTSAGVWDVIVGGLTAIPTLVFVVFMAFVLLISQVFALIAGALLNWVTSPSFVAISYTSPVDKGTFGQPDFLAGNPIIHAGLDITKSFVNLGLVVILVYIAVAIALRLGETGAKRLFAKLLLVALLVNFAPVLVGIIVDVTNIVMNYFLVGIDVGIANVGNQFSIWASGLVTKLFRVPTFAGQMGLIAQVLVMVTLNIGIGLAFLLFGAILLIRYVAIWTLVILSPLAFVAWILPATKKFWDTWWNQLVQWSVIGIPLAFFLYLGARAFETLPSIYNQPITMPGFSGEVAGAFSQALPYFVVLVFLFLGFTLGLQTSAMGAAAVISSAKRGGKWTGTKVGTGARKLAGRALGARGKEWMEKQAAAGFMPEKIAGMKGIKGALAKGAYSTFAGLPIWAVRRGMGEAGLRLKETEEKEIKTAEEKYKGTNAERKWADFNDPKIFMRSRAGILRAAIEDEQIDDFRTLGRKSGLTDDQINKRIIAAGKESLRTHPDMFKKIRDAHPQLAEEMGKGFAETTRKAAGLTFKDAAESAMYGGSIAAKITAKIKPANIPKMDIEGIFKLPPTDPIRVNIETAMHKFWTGEQVGAAARNFGRTFIEPFMALVNTKGRAWYHAENPRLETYLDSSAAKGLGLELP